MVNAITLVNAARTITGLSTPDERAFVELLKCFNFSVMSTQFSLNTSFRITGT